MKTLVVYYSRTGTTKKVAESISKEIKGDIEEILDTKNRDGVIGYIKAGRDATLKRLTLIKNINKNPKDYDLIIIGTPIWVWTMATPIRTYMIQNKGSFKNIALFCTMGGSKGKTFEEMEDLIGQKAKAFLKLKTREVNNGFIERVKDFIKDLNTNKKA
ncbi:MAG: flavodoxin [archaeon]